MRWLILLSTSIVLSTCAGSIGPPPSSISSLPSRDLAATDRTGPTPATAAPATAAPATAALATAAPATAAQATAVPVAPTGTPGFHADLPDLGQAPELNNAIWLNTDRPVRLADARGKVVLIDMWTFG